MDHNGGYINEGGQLKTKNGQKYIVTDIFDRSSSSNNGFYISKRLAILIAALVVLVMLAYSILIYFLFAHGPANAVPVKVTENQTDEVTKAGFISNPPSPSPPSSSPPLPPTVERPRPSKIQMHEGWSPTIYTLEMQPFLENGTSNGHVVIDIVKDDDGEVLPIVLDINNITITKAEVFENNAPHPALKHEIDESYGEKNSTYIITLRKSPKNTKLQLDLHFISKLTDTLKGFYRVGYHDIDTKDKKWLVSTQFSPIDAKLAFPCFDRPDKKARFNISLIHHENQMALSNMPSINITRLDGGYVREDFNITPIMSTYLVAFMATNLVKTKASETAIKDAKLPQINIWTRKEAADMTQFAFDLTTKILPFYEEYFGIRYDLPKIDMVAVPEFGFSAMENWGLITFRESALLVPADEEHRSSAGHTEHVASIIGHELAHQWFGNLVTMKWWDDLWLKEGFATFMSYLALNEIEPTWKTMDFISINELQKAMDEDADLSAHPISFPVVTESDIRRQFDPISYSKGASIIRMMQNFLGEETFKEALKAYLKYFKYKNAVHDDLWNVMTKFGQDHGKLPGDLTVKEIMNPWILQAGYPILTAIRNGTSINLSQQRYLLPNNVTSNDTQKWYIPITYVTGENPAENTVPKNWLSSENLTLPDAVAAGDYFYFNVQRSGYYRVNYDYKSWIALHRNYDKLPEIVIAQVIDDSLNLARAEIVSYDIPLSFLLKLRAQDVLPWSAATSGINFITNMLSRESAYEHFRALMRYIIKPIYSEMGFDEKPNESHVELMHRAIIVNQACFFSYDWCINRAQLIYREWMRDKTQNVINPNLKGVVYCTALREGSFQEWYFAYNRYLETTSASEKEIILDALGCTTKPWLLSKYLNMTITSDSGIRKQDGRRAFTAVAKNSIGFEIAFDFLMTNIKEISEYFGDGFSTLSKMVDSITRFMNKDYHLEKLKQFKTKAESLGLKSIGDSIKLAEQKVQNNVYWRSRSYYKLQMYLSSLTHDLHINLY